MTTISPIRYEVEIQAPLSTPVPMPPSMSSSEALVIWMLRIAMKAPTMPARMAIQVVRLAFSVPPPAPDPAPAGMLPTVAVALDMVLPPGSAARRPAQRARWAELVATACLVSMVG